MNKPVNPKYKFRKSLLTLFTYLDNITSEAAYLYYNANLRWFLKQEERTKIVDIINRKAVTELREYIKELTDKYKLLVDKYSKV